MKDFLNGWNSKVIRVSRQKWKHWNIRPKGGKSNLLRLDGINPMFIKTKILAYFDLRKTRLKIYQVYADRR
jgi:hypothetical protein